MIQLTLIRYLITIASAMMVPLCLLALKLGGLDPVIVFALCCTSLSVVAPLLERAIGSKSKVAS